MKKIALFLFVAVAVIAFGTGTARADRGFWFHSGAGGWTTYLNITNTGTAAATATVLFSSSDSKGSQTDIGSTSMTIQPNGQWNFNTGAIGTTALSTTALDGKRGTVKITGDTAGVIHGHSTQANSTYSGFDLTIATGNTANAVMGATGE